MGRDREHLTELEVERLIKVAKATGTVSAMPR